MKPLAKVFLLVALAALIAGALVAYGWYSIEKPFGNFAPDGVFVTIPKGASQRSAARILERNGVIRNAEAFEFYARRHPKRSLEAGEYFFDHALSGKDVFWKLANGEVYVQPFTVREGDTMFDIARNLENAKFMGAEDFLAAAQNPEIVRDIAPAAKTLEGFLYPATYNLPRHPKANDLTAEMVRKFREEWKELKAERAGEAAPENAGDPPAPHPVISIVTLASLVERETPKPDERPLVAGVFENRLKRGMLLQCDPTVIYALQQAGEYHGTLTGKDLKYDSPYNTYEHAGLPPGPIGNPGAVALKAALDPASTSYLYFVANTLGGHFFSSTLEEHNRNVTRYRRMLAGLPPDPPPQPKPVSKKKPQGRHSQGRKRRGNR